MSDGSQVVEGEARDYKAPCDKDLAEIKMVIGL